MTATFPPVGAETDPVAQPALAAHIAAQPAHGGDLAGTARPPTAHGHPQSDVTGLATALTAKQDASTAATDAELTSHAVTTGKGAHVPTAGLAVADLAFDPATQAELNTHEADTTAVHGIADTAALVLTSDARLLDVTPRQVRVFHNAAQTIASATDTALSFNSERFDLPGDNQHSTVTNTNRLVCVEAGLYLLACTLEFASNATGFRQGGIRLNGTTYVAVQRLSAVNGAATFINFSSVYRLAVNDYAELLVHQTSGGALDVAVSSNYSPEFGMARLGP